MDNTEKSIKKIAKDFLKTFTARVAKGDTHFTISLDLCRVISNSGTHYRYTDREGGEITLPYYESASSYANMVNSIYTEFANLVSKRLKGYVMREITETEWDSSLWSSRTYEVFSGVSFYRPCKEWKAVLKRLVKLGVDTKDLGYRWRRDHVFGKRSDYDVTGRFFKCVDSARCARVLEFLKGLKKIGFEVKRVNNLDDMEYGERYETEWSGSIDYPMSITAAKGSFSL